MWSSAAASDAHATTASTAAASSIATGVATPTANGRRSQQSPGVWSFDSSPFDSAGSSSSNASTNTTATTTNGVIGAGFVHSHVNKSRLLWNRTAPEEEEREEEALPSYLTYLQPSFRSSVSSSINGNDQRIQHSSSSFVGGAGGLGSGWGDDALSQRSSLSASSSHFIPSSASAFTAALSSNADGPFVSAASPTGMYSQGHNQHESSNNSNITSSSGGHGVETKSKELAFALQEFVRQQVEMQAAQHQHHRHASTSSSSSSPVSASGCHCEPLKRRVVDLEQKLLALSQQVAGLMGSSNHVHNPSTNTTVLAGPPGLAPPLQPPQPPVSNAMAGTPSMLQQQPPLPPTPPHSGGLGGVGAPMGTLGSPSAAAAVSGINDRVSTLEGRQSAFQSQLAQISKVLGVPIGKHGKNAQIKNLVQTLREEIDGKLSTSAKEIEAKCVQTVAETLENVVVQVVDERLQQANASGGAASSSSSIAASQLSYDAVFGALAEEHEASLAKLSAYYEERLVQESKQRVALESRIQSRFGEHEEWLQQLEGEFGSWHDRSSTVASQLRVLQTKIHEMDDKWKVEQLKWSKVAADLQLGVVVGSANTLASSMPGASSSSTTNSTSTTMGSTGASVETLTRTVHQLQTQYKQFHSEYKTETSELRENLVLMETWVKTTRQETRDLGKSTKGMKQLVEKLVRDTGSAEELLQQYVSTITHQVASVTRQYVSVRIRDNNRLIDATLRARVPAYLENESESFMLVRPEPKSAAPGTHESVVSNESHRHSSGLAASFVLKDDDEDAIRKLLKHEHTSSESSGASSPVAAINDK